MLELWTSKDCNYCMVLKEYLKENDIEFEEKVLNKDFSTSDLIVETSKRGNPTMSFPVMFDGDKCYTTRDFIRNGVLNKVWLEKNL